MNQLNIKQAKSVHLYIVIIICSIFVGLPSKAYAETSSFGANPTLLSNSELDRIREEQKAAYLGSPYNYCDASLLAQLWNRPSANDAIGIIGQKLMAGSDGIATVDRYLAEARSKETDEENVQCQYTDGGHLQGDAYSYDDALALAEFWNLSSVRDSKQLIGRKLELGQQDIIESALEEAIN